MKLKILGSVSPYSKLDKNCIGYLITDKSNKILLDCGSGVTRLMNFPSDLENLTIIISHLHKDHYADLAAIAYASYTYHNLGLLEKKIDVYIPSDNSLEDYNYLMNYGKENYFNIHTFTEKSSIDIGGINITFCQTKHPVLTFAINVTKDDIKISYTADTGYDDKLSLFCKEANILISDASFLEEQKKDNNAHLSAKEAALIAKDGNVQKLVLSHLFPEIDKSCYLKEAQSIFKNVEVAIENKEYDL